jgi:predicted GNAT superfamily acetyltransferase
MTASVSVSFSKQAIARFDSQRVLWRFNINYSHFLIPDRFVLASVAPLKGESK